MQGVGICSVPGFLMDSWWGGDRDGWVACSECVAGQVKVGTMKVCRG